MSEIFDIQTENKTPTTEVSKEDVIVSNTLPLEEKTPPIEGKKKKGKPRAPKPLTEERKQKLREQLKKGRETSANNRAKKAKLKKIDKEEKSKEDDKKLAEYYTSKTDKDNKDKQLNDLRLQLEEQNKIISSFREKSEKVKSESVSIPKVIPNKDIPSKPIPIPKKETERPLIVPKIVIPKKRILWVGMDD